MSAEPNATEEERQYLQSLADAQPEASHLTARRSKGALVLRDERGERPRPAVRFRRTGPSTWITDMASSAGQWTESRLEGTLPSIMDSLCEHFTHFLHPDIEEPEEGSRTISPEAEAELVRRGRRAALLTAMAWGAIIALCWTMPWGYLGVSLAILAGWVWSIATLRHTDGLMRQATAYGGFGEWLGPLIFLFVPLFTPIGFLMTLFRGTRILGGTVDGTAVSGGGQSRYFKKEFIGRAGQGTGLVLIVLAIAHPICLAVYFLRLDFLVLVEIVPG